MDRFKQCYLEAGAYINEACRVARVAGDLESLRAAINHLGQARVAIDLAEKRLQEALRLVDGEES